MTEQQYETSYDAIVLAAWERWTKNGLNLDDDDREQTLQSVRDAATSTWTDDKTEAMWLKATLAVLSDCL